MPRIVLLFAVAMNALGIDLRSWEAWPVFLLGIGFPAAYWDARRRGLPHLFAQQPLLHLPQEGELSEHGLRVRNEVGEARIPWRYVQTREWIRAHKLN